MKSFVNHIKLHGEIVEIKEVFSVRSGEQYQKFMIAVERLSGTKDILPVVINTKKLEGTDLSVGKEMTIEGTINVDLDDPYANRTHLIVCVCARDLIEETAEPCNEVELTGPICKVPSLRKTPLGRTVCDTMLMAAAGSNNPIPCIIWGSTAEEVSKANLFDSLNITGRLQSREYTKETEQGSEVRVFYEVSALTASSNRKQRS